MNARLRKAVLATLPALGVAFASPGALADTAQTSQPPQGAASAQSRAGQDMRVSQIIGKSIEDRGGRRVGEVEDLIIDTRNGKVAYAVITTSGYAEGGNRRVALPIDKVSGSVNRDRITLDVDPSRLASFPSFEEGRYPDWAQLGRAESSGRAEAAQPRQFRRASELLKADLKDRAGKDVGGVKDMVVSLQSGQIRYGVAEFDPSWFKQGKLVVVPVRDVQPAKDGDDLVLNVDREAMRNAPAFDPQRWPDVNDPGFQAQLDKYVGKVEEYTDRLDRRVGG